MHSCSSFRPLFCTVENLNIFDALECIIWMNELVLAGINYLVVNIFGKIIFECFFQISVEKNKQIWSFFIFPLTLPFFFFFTISYNFGSSHSKVRTMKRSIRSLFRLWQWHRLTMAVHRHIMESTKECLEIECSNRNQDYSDPVY